MGPAIHHNGVLDDTADDLDKRLSVDDIMAAIRLSDTINRRNNTTGEEVQSDALHTTIYENIVNQSLDHPTQNGDWRQPIRLRDTLSDTEMVNQSLKRKLDRHERMMADSFVYLAMQRRGDELISGGTVGVMWTVYMWVMTLKEWAKQSGVERS